MTEMAPAVTFVRGTHLVTGGSTGQLLPNSSMKVESALRDYLKYLLAGARSGHRGRAWDGRNRRTLLQGASGFKLGSYSIYECGLNHTIAVPSR